MRILVAGANGQLGRCLQDCLKNTSHQWLALSRSSLEITDSEQVRRVINEFVPEIVINAAAYTAVDRAESEPDLASGVNVEGGRILAESCSVVGARLLHVSTDYVFDGTAGSPYKEEDETSPIGVYGKTKLAGEKFVLLSSQRNFVLRTSWVFSEYGNNFLKTMIKLATREQIGVVADQFGGPTYAGDIAAALLSMAEKSLDMLDEGGVFHFSGAPSVSWFDFATFIFDEAERLGIIDDSPEIKPISTSEYPTPAKRPAYSVLSNDKVIRTFDVKPSDWRMAVSKVLRACS
ncbi:dTDP-4-dehydrorhamnose reductase [Hahella ganghwensis]|uniref:dTDP-4-dehydrorhamnose reductase n=1 Tax=Hahella ganghwensis TaxID=286420 RepID=UPI000380EA9C|nr:dTDP-4-dehydrorhamnose reductase [Hahella ganghwensis]